ncbi:MAG: hypothetical protein ACTSQI_05240 [Candidatus Helarchaeota archaeon]
MKKGTKRIEEFEERKQVLLDQMKELKSLIAQDKISEADYKRKSREIERELVEIMDRLTQLKFILQ